MEVAETLPMSQILFATPNLATPGLKVGNISPGSGAKNEKVAASNAEAPSFSLLVGSSRRSMGHDGAAS